MFDSVASFLEGDMPYHIEEMAREAIKVKSVDPALVPLSADLILDETPLIPVDKKRQSVLKKGKGKKEEDRDLDYHVYYKKFSECLNLLNAQAKARDNAGSKAETITASSPSPTKTNKQPLQMEKDKSMDREKESRKTTTRN